MQIEKVLPVLMEQPGEKPNSFEFALEKAYQQIENFSSHIDVEGMSDFDKEEYVKSEQKFAFQDGRVVIHHFPTNIHDYMASHIKNA